MAILPSQDTTEPACDRDSKAPGRLVTVLWLTCGIVVVYAMFSVPRKVLELSLSGQFHLLADVISALVAAASAWLCWRYQMSLARLAQDAAKVFAQIGRRRWLLLAIGSGILIRLAWLWYFPTVQTSDHATYVVLAKKLIAGEPYFDGEAYSNWPPGLPFFLAANLFVFGDHPWVIPLANLLLYALATLTVYKLAYLVAGEGVSRVATLILLFWPNDIMCTGLAKKELLILPMLTGAILAYVTARRTTNSAESFWLLAATGGLLGAASLTQPSLILFPSALVFYEFTQRASARKFTVRIGVVIVAMCVVILPWSIRNYLVLGAVVPISTAGGEGFYSANNGLATGSHVPVYERSLDQFDEVTRSKMGYRWGLEWISQHPGGFLELTVNRQVQVLGEDSDGAYWGVKVGGRREGLVYLIAKGISNAYWMAIMFLILAAVLVHWRGRAALSPDILLLMLSLFYVVAIDSIFQSGSRHHMPLMGTLSVLAALVARRPQVQPVSSRR
jgi:4-amino-4-deoxy-L-arabinose transferase-like glycosyltransferase